MQKTVILSCIVIKKTNLTTDSTQGLIGYSYKFNDDHRESRESIKRIKLSDIVRVRDCSRRLVSSHGYCTAQEIAVVDEQWQIFTARRYSTLFAVPLNNSHIKNN